MKKPTQKNLTKKQKDSIELLRAKIEAMPLVEHPLNFKLTVLEQEEIDQGEELRVACEKLKEVFNSSPVAKTQEEAGIEPEFKFYQADGYGKFQEAIDQATKTGEILSFLAPNKEVKSLFNYVNYFSNYLSEGVRNSFEIMEESANCPITVVDKERGILMAVYFNN